MPPLAPSVLIIEDDADIGSSLQAVLRDQGYDPTWTRTGTEGLAQPIETFAVILLDLGLPDMDGLEVCRTLRRRAPHVPVLMLTARGSETDIVVGLDAGADDYLAKPFRLAELLARLRALARRNHLGITDLTAITVGDLAVDTQARRAFIAGTEIDLRAKEFDLLAVLMQHAGKVLTREQAMSLVWDEHWFGSTKTLDVTLASLRHQLGDGPTGSRITTLRGIGYRLEVPDQEPDPT